VKVGETVITVGVSNEYIDQGPPPYGEKPVDPGYGIDLGLGPAHPIVLPPDPTVPLPPVDPDYSIPIEHPDQGLPPASGTPGTPTHPIVTPPAGPQWKVMTAWTPRLGWVVVAVPVGEHPTPSGGTRKAAAKPAAPAATPPSNKRMG
jgi:hypothetical protein